MGLRKLLIGFGVASAMVFGSSVVNAQTNDEAEADEIVQQRAVDALDKMAGHLKTLTDFKLTAISTSDDVLDNGQKIQIQGEATFDVRRPDRLKVHVVSDKQERIYFYDGATLTQYAPALDYYATVDANPTISETLLALEGEYGLHFPLVDIFLWAGSHEPKVDIEAAYYAGRSTILGNRCDHYAFRVSGADVQIWTRATGDPLPCRMVITDLTDAARPEFEATLIWNTDSSLGDSAFSFVPPPGRSRSNRPKPMKTRAGSPLTMYRPIRTVLVASFAIPLALASVSDLAARGHGGGGGGGGGGGSHNSGGGGLHGGGVSFHGGGGGKVNFSGGDGGGQHHHDSDHWQKNGVHIDAWGKSDDDGTGITPGITASPPGQCDKVKQNGVDYQKCGSRWYVPRYQGSDIYYRRINPPG